MGPNPHPVLLPQLSQEARQVACGPIHLNSRLAKSSITGDESTGYPCQLGHLVSQHHELSISSAHAGAKTVFCCS